ncbi:2-amino-4-hydroxy-6-hydroxymethyldihydropteridine diphosphokinase [Salinibacillus xinjiangensis]
MRPAYIALGSNIEPRYDWLQSAIQHLNKHSDISVESQSEIYETEPVGYTDQGNFLNMVVKIETSLAPFELLSYCQNIETLLGRKREIRFGPRTVDLDILLYNQENMYGEQLTIPHPRMEKRAFVLIPLADLNDQLVIRGKTVKELLSQLPQQDYKGVAKWIDKSGVGESGPFVN